MATGGIVEPLTAMIRKHEINEGFLVTGMLIPLTLPPTIPLWMVVIGTAFGTIFAKEIFGGTGMNFLNPALTARAFLFFAYPAAMSGDPTWIAADFSGVDSFSGATLLAQSAVSGEAALAGASWMDAFLGFVPGSMGETSALACLIGAALLLWTGIGSWRTMAGVVTRNDRDGGIPEYRRLGFESDVRRSRGTGMRSLVAGPSAWSSWRPTRFRAPLRIRANSSTAV